MFSTPSFRNQTTPRYDFFRFSKNRQNKKSPLRGFSFPVWKFSRRNKRQPPHIMTSFALKERKHSLRMICTLFPNNETKSSSNKAIHPHTGRHRFLRTISIHCGPPWSVRRLTAKYGMSYLTYFIAFMHRFLCTFCAYFFYNSEFQQSIVVICSFFLLLFLE